MCLAKARRRQEPARWWSGAACSAAWRLGASDSTDPSALQTPSRLVRYHRVMTLVLGLAIGFVGGTAATLLTLFLAGHLRERASAPPPRWVDTGGWEDATSTARS